VSKVISPSKITSIDDIQLDRDLVIEASAGTGKTYTIENLVVRLIQKGYVKNLDQILIVTFTEKATGELKQRIRKNIEKELEKNHSRALEESLDNFDSASIHTIHGFCNRTLKEYAFENSEPFSFELVDDSGVYRKMLHQQMRETLPVDFGEDLARILMLSGFPNVRKGSGESGWENRIIDIASSYQPDGGDILRPGYTEGLSGRIRKTEEQISLVLEALGGLVGKIDREKPERSEFVERYTTLKVRAPSIKKRISSIIIPILNLLCSYEKNGADLLETSEFLRASTDEKYGFNVLKYSTKDNLNDYEDRFPELDSIVEELEKISSLEIDNIADEFVSGCIERLKKSVLEYKQERGLISYDDMLGLVNRALVTGDGQLASTLRKRYVYALVDEFQDTDAIQWNIFKKVFLEGENNRLIVVGDPKQAIYGFRGADVHVYFEARHQMINEYNAGFYFLGNNWRSVRGLIESFNLLFGGDNWFCGNDIEYIDSSYPENAEEHLVKMAPYSGEQDNMILVDLGECSGREAAAGMAAFTANEITALLEKDQPKILPSEIAVLVRKKSESEAVELELRQKGIAFSLYKNEGLYKSEEALQLLYLFTAISDPSDIQAVKRALVTDFFRIPLKDLASYENTEQTHAVKRLFFKWSELAVRKEWGRLIQSVTDDTGLYFKSWGLTDRERKISNYMEILHALVSEAYRSGSDIRGVANYLKKCIESPGKTEEDLHSIETDEPRVQIMTIHASKGLEFKVVFIAGGYTSSSMPSFLRYHEGGRRIFDISSVQGNSEKYKQEEKEEALRLYYVALTRASFRLYIPDFKPSKRSKPGPAGTFLHDALDKVRDHSSVTCIHYDADYAEPVIREREREIEPEKKITVDESILQQGTDVFFERNQPVDSFSGLKKKAEGFIDSGVKEMSGFGEKQTPVPGDDDADMEALDEEPSDLPHGSDTGSMLHEILENMDFSLAAEHDNEKDFLEAETVKRLFNCKMDLYFGSISPELREVYNLSIASIIWNTLRADISSNGMRLCDINSRIHEMEFYFSITRKMETSIPEAFVRNGFIHGFIDLVFRHEDRYYFLDWKSNFIEQGYTPEKIEANIRDSKYDLQYRVYTLAVLKWLKQVLPDFSYEKHFGGIFYIYMRGMDVKSEGNGVFFYRPDYHLIREYEEEIEGLITK